MINSPMFSNSLKPDDITSLLKKGRKYLKENYRPIGILPTLSKVFENKCLLKCLLSLTIFFLKIPMWILETLYYSKHFSTISEKCADKGKVFPVL